MRFAVTGASGFIGRHLLSTLQHGGHEFIVFERRLSPVGKPSNGQRLVVDLASPSSVEKALDATRPEIILHLAGTPARGHRPGYMTTCVEANILTTVNLLEVATRLGIARIVTMGSAAEYGQQKGPWHERLPTLATSPYGISKAAATSLARSLFESEGAPVVVLRPFTIYGPGQPLDMFVAEAISRAIAGDSYHVRNGWQRQDLVYVGDLCEAILAAALGPNLEGCVINIGSGVAPRLQEIADIIWTLSGAQGALTSGGTESLMNGQDPRAETKLARELLRWSPATDLTTGLSESIRWARQVIPGTIPL